MRARTACAGDRGTYLDQDKWFKAEVQKGLAQLDNGESLSHDEVVASIERMFQL
jgi:predicted transcriptional regulator